MAALAEPVHYLAVAVVVVRQPQERLVKVWAPAMAAMARFRLSQVLRSPTQAAEAAASLHQRLHLGKVALAAAETAATLRLILLLAQQTLAAVAAGKATTKTPVLQADPAL